MATTELALPKIIEILGPGGGYELRRRELQKQLEPIIAEAKKVTAIKTAEEAEDATKLGRLLQAGLKEQEAHFKAVKLEIDAIKRPVLEAEKVDAAAAEREKARLGQLQTEFAQEQAKLARERQRAADEAARKQAEEEALLRAIEQSELGDEEAAEQILAEPVVAMPVVVQQHVDKPKGAVQMITYSCQVENLMALVKAVAEGKIPAMAVMANESYLNGRARGDKESFAIPGCKLVTQTKTTYRS